ncbi:MAG: hypothetical protein NT164_01425 [Verrucomicrobiae bacterium]|nr:hypothetical protein [Verrucomicrobiae bacterium]
MTLTEVFLGAQVTDRAAIESLNSFFEGIDMNLNDVNVPSSAAENSLSSAAAAMEEEPASAPSAAIVNAGENGGGNEGDQPNRITTIAAVRNILIGQINQRIAFRNGLIAMLENKIASLEEARKNITPYDRANKKMTSPWSSHARF